MTDLNAAYSPERFREQGHAVIDLLADCLTASMENDNQPVVEMTDPESAYAEIESLFQRCSDNEIPKIEELFQHVYGRTIRLHSPRYVGHQISPPLPVSALASLMSDLLNNGMGVYEMGIAGTVMERFVIKSLCRKFGFDEQADGYLTSGGILGNLTALLAARRAIASDDVWAKGTGKRLALMVSDQAHYCIDKAARVMGWGEEGVILIPTKTDFSMQTEVLESQLEFANQKGLEVIAVVGSACSTATGAFDDLVSIGQFCRKHKLWFHVDGAHGAATIYSDEFRHRLAGIETADSITMDFHKLLMTPALATALVFKDGRFGAQNFAQNADYLWSKSTQDDDGQTEWHDLARRTFECTKSMLGFKVFTIMATLGEQVFDENVTTLYRSAAMFAGLIQKQADFELATTPQSNIVCFRFVSNQTDSQLDELNRQIRQEIVTSGEFYLVQTVLKDRVWLRCTIANPFTNADHFDQLLRSIRACGNRVLENV